MRTERADGGDGGGDGGWNSRPPQSEQSVPYSHVSQKAPVLCLPPVLPSAPSWHTPLLAAAQASEHRSGVPK